MPDEAHHPRKTCKRFNIPHHAHFLTFSCYRRQPFLSGEHGPRWFLECLDRTRAAEEFRLWAYVIMPEHVHLLIAPGETCDVSRMLWRLKAPLAVRVIAFLKSQRSDYLSRLEHREAGGRIKHRFWQPGGGYDRNLWTPSEIRDKIDYIHANPVRRGLVETPELWRWSSAKAWQQRASELARIDFDSVPDVET